MPSISPLCSSGRAACSRRVASTLHIGLRPLPTLLLVAALALLPVVLTAVDQPFYVGYEVGGFELGLVPEGRPGPGGTVAYWGVPDAAAAMERFEALGIAVREPLQDVGEGIKVAAVGDPFGNLFGIIENPQFSLAKVR